MEEQQYRISAGVAAYRDLLLDTANREERGLFDALGWRLCMQGSDDWQQDEDTDDAL